MKSTNHRDWLCSHYIRSVRQSLFLFLFPSLISPVYAQQSTDTPLNRYARAVVDTLCSSSMHGRGYVNRGDKIAAQYLEDQFRADGLTPFGTGFRQQFSLNVNTFPGRMMFKYSSEKKPQTPGRDFLVDPVCHAVKGTFKLVYADSTTIKNEGDLVKIRNKRYKNRMLFVDTIGVRNAETRKRIVSLLLEPPQGVNGIIVRQRWSRGPGQDTPGPWDVAQAQAGIPVIYSRTSNETPKARKITVDIEAQQLYGYSTQNMLGYVKGSVFPDSFIVFTAHYDHLGQMGADAWFPGANDNASGCAMLLNLMKYFTSPDHHPKCSVAFIAFSGEEAGLLGSKFYTEHPLFPLKQIRFLVNMDIMGTGDEGITVVNATLFPDQFRILQQVNEKGQFLPDVKMRGKASNSDHYWFSEKGVNAFFIYTRGGIKAYHDIDDKPSTLPLSKFKDVYNLLISFESFMENWK